MFNALILSHVRRKLKKTNLDILRCMSSPVKCRTEGKMPLYDFLPVKDLELLYVDVRKSFQLSINKEI